MKIYSPRTGRPIVCVWTDCERPGDDRYARVVVDGELSRADGVPELLVGTPKKLTYLFCGERHRSYWENSHQDMGNLPAGQRAPR